MAQAMLKSLATPKTRPFLPENKPIASPLDIESPGRVPEGRAPATPKDNEPAPRPQPQRTLPISVRAGVPILILIAAAVPRFWDNGRESYWYDEVVTVEVARSSNVIASLKRMDASRAPLHPLVLNVWMRAFGEGERATRSLSALLGLGTVALVFLIGRQIGGWGSGCWGMAFAAASPLLVLYDRETRMYALIAMLTALAWWHLMTFRASASWRRCAVQAGLLASLAYAHPLGLLMIAGLAAGWLADRGRSRLRFKRWLAIQLGAALLILPWIVNYVDHPPEFTSDARALRFLIGMPIGFTGGDSRSLAIFGALIALALSPRRIPGLARASAGGAWPIVAWLVVAPSMLFAYSQFGPSLFGPSRYNVFAAPAYFVLIGCGLSRLRLPMGLVVGGLLIVSLSLPELRAVVESRTRADWRGASEWLIANRPGSTVIVISPDKSDDRELRVARYYLRGNVRAVPMERDSPSDQPDALGLTSVTYSVSLRRGMLMGELPPWFRVSNIDALWRSITTVGTQEFAGTLRLVEFDLSFPDIHLDPIQ